jgi:hypothetical protein
MILGKRTICNASLSHSGKMLAFLSSTTSFVSVPTLAVMPINGNANDIITIPFDRDKTNITLNDDDIYFYLSKQWNYF